MEVVTNGLGQRLDELSLYFPDLTMSHIIVGVFAALVAVLLAQFETRWWPRIKNRVGAWIFAIKEAKRKKMRTKEAMDKREVRLRELLGEIIVDGLLDLGVQGKLSIQEEKRLTIWASQKLGIPDLVSQKLRFETIKQEIKARFYKTETYYKNGVAFERPLYRRTGEEIAEILRKRKAQRETPPPLPREAQAVKPAPSANKYWKPKPVAA